jgi:uncharacterized membrane protein YhaH (DUF805 family)
MNGMGWYLLGWKRIGEISGRSSRREYWTFILVNYLVFACLAFASVLLFLPDDIDSRVTAIRIAAGICFVALLISTLSIRIRRLHDTGRSGWWILIGLVPYVGALALFIITLLESEPGPNQYGANPKLIAKQPDVIG